VTITRVAATMSATVMKAFDQVNSTTRVPLLVAMIDTTNSITKNSSTQTVKCQSQFSSAIKTGELGQINRFVELTTFWYCFLALITALALLVSLISNMIIIYIFSR